MITNINYIKKLQKVMHDTWAASDTKEQSLWPYFLAVISTGDIWAIAEMALGKVASVLLAWRWLFLWHLV